MFPVRAGPGHNPRMHKRADFSRGDPSWDAIEAQWMRQIAAGGPGREAALGDLYEVYAPVFVRWLNRRGLSAHDAQDVVHDLWIDELVPAIGRWKGNGPARLYLHGILKMSKRRWFHAAAHAPVVESTDDESITEEAAAAVPLFAWAARAKPTDWFDFARCVRRALAKLGASHPRLVRLLELVHVEQLSLDEAADELGGDAKLAKGQVFSAREKVRPGMAPCLELWPDRGRR